MTISYARLNAIVASRKAGLCPIDHNGAASGVSVNIATSTIEESHLIAVRNNTFDLRMTIAHMMWVAQEKPLKPKKVTEDVGISICHYLASLVGQYEVYRTINAGLNLATQDNFYQMLHPVGPIDRTNPDKETSFRVGDLTLNDVATYEAFVMSLPEENFVELDGDIIIVAPEGEGAGNSEGDADADGDAGPSDSRSPMPWEGGFSSMSALRKEEENASAISAGIAGGRSANAEAAAMFGLGDIDEEDDDAGGQVPDEVLTASHYLTADNTESDEFTPYSVAVASTPESLIAQFAAGSRDAAGAIVNQYTSALNTWTQQREAIVKKACDKATAEHEAEYEAELEAWSKILSLPVVKTKPPKPQKKELKLPDDSEIDFGSLGARPTIEQFLPKEIARVLEASGAPTLGSFVTGFQLPIIHIGGVGNPMKSIATRINTEGNYVYGLEDQIVHIMVVQDALTYAMECVSKYPKGEDSYTPPKRKTPAEAVVTEDDAGDRDTRYVVMSSSRRDDPNCNVLGTIIREATQRSTEKAADRSEIDGLVSMVRQGFWKFRASDTVPLKTQMIIATRHAHLLDEANDLWQGVVRGSMAKYTNQVRYMAHLQPVTTLVREKKHTFITTDMQKKSTITGTAMGAFGSMRERAAIIMGTKSIGHDTWHALGDMCGWYVTAMLTGYIVVPLPHDYVKPDGELVSEVGATVASVFDLEASAVDRFPVGMEGTSAVRLGLECLNMVTKDMSMKTTGLSSAPYETAIEIILTALDKGGISRHKFLEFKDRIAHIVCFAFGYAQCQEEMRKIYVDNPSIQKYGVSKITYYQTGTVIGKYFAVRSIDPMSAANATIGIYNSFANLMTSAPVGNLLSGEDTVRMAPLVNSMRSLTIEEMYPTKGVDDVMADSKLKMTKNKVTIMDALTASIRSSLLPDDGTPISDDRLKMIMRMYAIET